MFGEGIMNEDSMRDTALISLGRIEARLDSMSEKENRTGARLDRLEQGQTETNIALTEMKGAIIEIKNSQKPKAPWWVIVGGIAGVITAILGFWTLFNIAVNASVIPA